MCSVVLAPISFEMIFCSNVGSSEVTLGKVALILTL